VPKKSLKSYNKDNFVAKGDKSEKVAVKVKDGKATATLPVGSSDINEVWKMLKERGFDPDQWEIQSLTVNQWEAPGTEGVELYEQTKATLKQKPQFLGEFIKSLGSLGETGFSPQPSLKAKKSKPELLVVLGDHQLPFANEKLVKLSHSFLQDVSPDGLIYMGDLIDFPNLSKFESNPDFTSTVQQGIDLGYSTLRDLRDSAGLTKKDEMIFIEGNHEVRLRRALINKLPQLFGIKRADVGEEEKSVLHLANLMRFNDLGWIYWDEPSDVYPHPEYEIVKGLFARHGNFVRAKAGMSAMANLDRVDGSIIQGHTHRLAITHHTRWTGQEMNLYSAIETGTMADLKGLGYSKQPDWQGGFITLVVDRKNNTFHPELVIFNEDKITWRGFIWTLTTKGVRTNYESNS
jgi:hypothetical protein